MQPASFRISYSRKASLKRPWLAGTETETACRKKLEAGSLARSGFRTKTNCASASRRAFQLVASFRSLGPLGSGEWCRRRFPLSRHSGGRRRVRGRRDEPSAARARDGGSRERAGSRLAGHATRRPALSAPAAHAPSCYHVGRDGKRLRF